MLFIPIRLFICLSYCAPDVFSNIRVLFQTSRLLNFWYLAEALPEALFLLDLILDSKQTKAVISAAKQTKYKNYSDNCLNRKQNIFRVQNEYL